MITRVFHSKTKTVNSAAFLLGISSLISGVLGLLRDRLLAGRFGASVELDIYFAAFRIPDFVYGLLILGGLSIAFLPIFSEFFQRGKGNLQTHEWPHQATEFVNNLLNCFLLLLILICLILAVLAPFFIHLIIPGFSPENKAITVQLVRILFLSPIIFGISSIFSGILQYFDRFLAYALAPVLYNLGIIFGILFLAPIFGIKGVVYGVILGAFAHLLIQIPAAKISGFNYRFIFNFRHSGIKKILKMMGPRLMGVTADQLNLVIITSIASILSAGSIAILNFSKNIQGLPIAIIGVSFAVASFPVFSRHVANGQKEEFLEHFSSSLRQILFFIVPASFLIFLLRAQIIRLILGTGQFGWWETRLTAATLGILSIGLLARSLLPLVVRAFFSFKDTKTPAVISVVSVFLNISLCLFFVFLLKQQGVFTSFWQNLMKLKDIQNIELIGIPLGFSLTVGVQLLLLLVFLYKKIKKWQEISSLRVREIWQSFKTIFIISLIMTFATYLFLQVLAGLVNMQTFWGVFWQLVLASVFALVVYVFFSFIFSSRELEHVKSLVQKWLR